MSTCTKLTSLSCSDNQLTTLNVNNTKLELLWCHGNQLTTLDLSEHTALWLLYCNSNQLTTLDVSSNTALSTFLCNNNPLTSLRIGWGIPPSTDGWDPSADGSPSRPFSVLLPAVSILHNAVLQIPVGTKSLYQAVTPWKDFGNMIESGEPFSSLVIDPTTLNLPQGSSTQYISVTSNVSWSVSKSPADASWLTIHSGLNTSNGTIHINASANTTNAPRTVTLTVYGIGVESRQITVTQGTSSDPTDPQPPVPVPPPSIILSLEASNLLTPPGSYPSTNQSFTFDVVRPSGSSPEVILEIVNMIDGVEYPSTVTYSQTDELDKIRVTISNITTDIKVKDVSYIGSTPEPEPEPTPEPDPDPEPVNPDYSLSVSSSSLDYKAGGESKIFSISSNVGWSIEVDVDWLGVSVLEGIGDMRVSLTASANMLSAVRSGVLTVRGAGVASQSIVVTQRGESGYHLEVSPLELTYTPGGERKSIAIMSNVDWAISVDVDWLTPSVWSSGGNLNVILSSEVNTSSVPRTGVVSISGSNGVESSRISVVQLCNVDILPTSLSLNRSKASLTVGSSLQLIPLVLPLNAVNREVIWSSSNPSVAKVYNGVIEAYREDTVTITATSVVGGYSASCALTVTAPQRISISPLPSSSSSAGSIDISLPIPANASFEGSFLVTLPAGIILDTESSTLAVDLQSEYRLAITSKGNGIWLFEITRRISPYSVAVVADRIHHPAIMNVEFLPHSHALVSPSSSYPSVLGKETERTELLKVGTSSSYSSVESAILLASGAPRPIVTVAYTTSSTLPAGSHTVRINDLAVTYSDSTSLQQSEILVPITTVSTPIHLIPESTVVVSLSSDILTVTSPSPETLTIYSLSGNLLYRADKEQGNTSFDVGHLPRGVLIIHGSSGWVRKVFRQ
jgi:hypothetical protein